MKLSQWPWTSGSYLLLSTVIFFFTCGALKKDKWRDPTSFRDFDNVDSMLSLTNSILISTHLNLIDLEND